jgi:hypothetical protein
MSLLKPSPGEVIDRLSILLLKIKASAQTNRNVGSLLAEIAELNGYLNPLVPSRKGFADLEHSVYCVNGELWQLEDKVRALPSTAVLDLAKVAKEIAAKNDERMRIVREIDKAFGWNETPSEKIYGVP